MTTVSTRSGRRVVPPLPQEPHTLDERARLVQSRTEESNREHENQPSTDSETDGSVPPTPEGETQSTNEDGVVTVLDLLKEIKGTQPVGENDSDDDSAIQQGMFRNHSHYCSYLR